MSSIFIFSSRFVTKKKYGISRNNNLSNHFVINLCASLVLEKCKHIRRNLKFMIIKFELPVEGADVKTSGKKIINSKR